MQALRFFAASVFVGCLSLTPVYAQTSSISVSGAVGSPRTFDGTALGSLPQVTRTETYRSAGVPVTDTFTGPTLWNVLQASGGIATEAGVRNGVLNTYVVATGADGYKAVFSGGEISPSFGNKPDLVATSDTAGRLPGADGFARVTASADIAGGRYVSQLTSLSVGIAPRPAMGQTGVPTTSFSLNGGVKSPGSYDLARLMALPFVTQTVTYTSGGRPVTSTFTGVPLFTLFTDSGGLILDPTVKNDILRQALVVRGSDGYQAVFSLGELSPAFGNSGAFVAYAENGAFLSGTGFARIVVPGDIAGGRYVSNLESLTVFDATRAVAVPGPIAGAGLLPLLALAGLGLARRKKGRRTMVRFDA